MRTLRNNGSYKSSERGILLILFSLLMIGGSTFAFFTYRLSGTSTLNFGKIQVSDISSNLSLTKPLDNVIPGDELLTNPISFSVSNDSKDLMARLKIVFTANGTVDDKVNEYIKSLNNKDWTNYGTSNDTLNVSIVKDSETGYYYVVDKTTTTNMKVLTKNDNVVFATSMKVPTDLVQASNNASGEPLQYGNKIDCTITVEAIQSDNFVAKDGVDQNKTVTNVAYVMNEKFAPSLNAPKPTDEKFFSITSDGIIGLKSVNATEF
jgi:hypothetical protein